MYLGFELEDYKPLEQVSQQAVEEYKARVRNINIQDLAEFVVTRLQGHDVLDAKKLARILFPAKQAHIFLSHSHRDEENAIKFAIAMEKRGVKVFIDSCVWGYMDELLDIVNEKYSESEIVGDQKYFSHRKCNEASAAVHMLLMTELHRMIDETECFVFLNTKQSVPIGQRQLESGRMLTLSPWIHSELSFSAQVRARLPSRKRLSKPPKPVSEVVYMEEAFSIASSAVFGFDVATKHLPTITGAELRAHFKRTPHREGFYLDSLYYQYDLEEAFPRGQPILQY
ncbi:MULTISPECIES: toll/interleukin-1 receptor domain-containing protein [unclassified Pseudomonas]|uniref:toll/interleukin-1 receptor domain-containing protein n=1 Tax=unclassified Pseudomonas TaxID=196821 RepID=UPI001E4B511A|nr:MULTISPECIES: toll/interleukin-1 receptor domain-containing protein [unclassified Pseudomonas]MDH1692360.1 toll/interleukin-1 receptor domain-containing protein [Pseudomonas sp. GD03766]UFH29556.1 toll/interleukin-1 receptor domain-containing protein [Pseudomonas sp. CIP-10]